MIVRSIALALCLGLLCLGAVTGCAPPVGGGQPSGGTQAPPSVTTPTTDTPSFDEEAPASATAPGSEAPALAD